MAALQTAQLKYDGIASKISYNGIVDAVDVFEEEFNSEKVMFINPKQVAQIRKDKDFLAADKIAERVIMSGAIGKIANCEIVPSKKVPENEAGTGYVCPIVKLNEDGETENDAPALTIYMKRDVNLETERFTLARKTAISSSIAFKTTVCEKDVDIFSLRNITKSDIDYIKDKFGKTVRYMGFGIKNDSTVSAFVEPVILPTTSLEANVNKNFNIIT